MNIGEIAEVHCDLEGQPVNYPQNYSFTGTRKFKVIGKSNKEDLYLLDLHYASPVGVKDSRMDLNNFELMSGIDSTNLPLMKFFPVTSNAFLTRIEVKSSGGDCVHCGEHYPYAEVKRQDKKFLCYSCRDSMAGRYPGLA